MSGQRNAGSPFGTTPTHHTDAPHTGPWLALFTLGCTAAILLILVVIPWACGVWT